MEKGLVALAAALAVGIPALATAFAQARIGSVAAGSVAEKPCGSFTYIKQFPKRQEKVLVEVFPMAIERQLDDWQEKGQREVRFFNPVDAAALVSDAGVGDLILAFFVDLAKKKAAGTLKAPAAPKAASAKTTEDQASPSNSAVDK